jgi:hypothetical protein
MYPCIRSISSHLIRIAHTISLLCLFCTNTPAWTLSQPIFTIRSLPFLPRSIRQLTGLRRPRNVRILQSQSAESRRSHKVAAGGGLPAELSDHITRRRPAATTQYGGWQRRRSRFMPQVATIKASMIQWVLRSTCACDPMFICARCRQPLVIVWRASPWSTSGETTHSIYEEK